MNDLASLHENAIGATKQLEKLFFAVLQRQAYVETALAKAQGVQVHYLQLRSSPPIPIWDFSKHRDLIENGYDIACHEITDLVKKKSTLSSSASEGKKMGLAINQPRANGRIYPGDSEILT